MSSLNEEQEHAIAGTESSLVLAGPGSGKTRTVVSAIEREIRSKGPKNIVAITFTNAAANELIGRLETIFGERQKLAYAGTIHGFCLAVVTRFLHRGATMVDEESAEDMLAESARTLRWKGHDKKLREAVEKVVRGEEPTAIAGIVARHWHKAMRDAGLYTFDMIQHEALKALRWNELKPRFDLLVVDEIQDSSKVDFEIFEAVEATRRIYIGDPNQAIYGFRGGSLEGILTAQTRYRTVALSTNYRSTPAICDCANKLMLKTAKTCQATIPASLSPHGSVKLTSHGSSAEEASNIANRIAELIEAGEDPNEIAVLGRVRRVVAPVAAVLRVKGIPTAESEPDAIPEDWHRAIATLQLWSNPTSEHLQNRWIMESFGKAKARDVTRKAALAGKPPIETIFCPDLPDPGQDWEQHLNHLNRWGLSPESIHRVKRIASEMRDPYPASVLCEISRMSVAFRTASAEGVTCTTMHGAKGLEWNHVFLVGVEDEILPGKRGEIAEERRILYVAITRARMSLTISYSNSRPQQWGNKNLAEAHKSRYVEELLS